MAEKPNLEITVSEWLKDLEALEQGETKEGFYTVHELEDIWGIAEGTVRKRLRSAASLNWLKRIKTRRVSPLTGQSKPTFAYRIDRPKKAKKKK